MAVIYKLTNKLSGMIYVGCTINFEKRMREHKNDAKRKNTDLYKAIRMDGFESFDLSIIEEVDDAIRFAREKYWIAKLNSTDPSIGYNRTIGGLGTVGYVFTEKDKEKKNKNLKGKCQPTAEQIERLRNLNKGKHLPKEVRDKLSKACMGRPSPFKGCHHTEESKQLSIKTKKELKILRGVVGISIDTGEKIHFDSIADAARFILGFRDGKHTTILSHIRNSIVGVGQSKSAYGYRWEYAEGSNDYPDRE